MLCILCKDVLCILCEPRCCDVPRIIVYSILTYDVMCDVNVSYIRLVCVVCCFDNSLIYLIICDDVCYMLDYID